jgi:hypothetical protein
LGSRISPPFSLQDIGSPPAALMTSPRGLLCDHVERCRGLCSENDCRGHTFPLSVSQLGTRFETRNCISEPGPQEPYKDFLEQPYTLFMLHTTSACVFCWWVNDFIGEKGCLLIVIRAAYVSLKYNLARWQRIGYSDHNIVFISRRRGVIISKVNVRLWLHFCWLHSVSLLL